MTSGAALPTSFRIVSAKESAEPAKVSVSISLYNYEETVEDALSSVASQTISAIDLVVVDDASSDDGLGHVVDWCRQNGARFNSIQIAKNDANSGLARTRNLGFELAGSEFVFVLDADNRLLPRCLERLVEGISGTTLALVWGIGQVFGSESRLISATRWDPERLSEGPYIDAAALIRRQGWKTVSGYHEMPAMGWEDYDFYCRIHEAGLAGEVVPEILWSYRSHRKSMLGGLRKSDYSEIREWMMNEHPWLKL